MKAVFDNLLQEVPKKHFTVGIKDDVTHTSLEVGPTINTQDPEVTQVGKWSLSRLETGRKGMKSDGFPWFSMVFHCFPRHFEALIANVRTREAVFFGLGSDGTVGANKAAAAIIGERTEFYSQAGP